MSALTRSDATRSFSPVAAICAIVGCEVVTVAASPLAGAICDAIVFLSLVNAFVLMRQDGGEAAVLLALALIPLVRLIGFAIPVAGVSRVLRDALVAAMLLQALLTGRVAPVGWAAVGLHRRELPAQLRIAVCGIPVGIAAQQILHPHPLVEPGDPAGMVLGILVLGCLAAPSIELLFRRVLQDHLLALHGDAGLVLLNALFASLYLGTRSPGFAIPMGVAGLALSVAARRTGSIWGAVAAHGLFDIGVLIVWPAVLG